MSIGKEWAMKKTRQLNAWTGEFGKAYLDRNTIFDDASMASRETALAPIVTACAVPPQSILEVGSNVGMNLVAFQRLTKAALHAVEPNKDAYDRLVTMPGLTLTSASIAAGQDLPFDDNSIDFIFTSGVLIHIAPDDLATTVIEIVRVARSYIWCNEYFAKTPETMPYRGEDGLLFKRDFGRLYLELFPSLRPIATGFLWSATTPYDDTTWWLFEKTSR